MRHQEWFLGERRNFLQILAEILEFCRQPRSKIRMMQYTGTSFKLAGKYLLKLQKLGFLEKLNGREMYTTTEKGKEFLELWEQLIELLQVEEKESSC